jgi:hypothetical protein
MSVSTAIDDEIIYPETDGKPMGDNTLQIKWMLMLYGGLDALFITDQDVFVACNLNWYPVEGDNKKVTAPDVFVVFGRPKGERSSYMQWKEAGVPPTVVFEILSPSNSERELEEKFDFYERCGVEEYYIYDPNGITMEGFRRKGKKLSAIPEMNGWVSPRMETRFDLSGSELVVCKPDNTPFLTYSELSLSRQAEYLRAEDERKKAEDERKKNELLLAKLKAHGIDPDTL